MTTWMGFVALAWLACAAALAAPPGASGASELCRQLEDCLLARFQETDRSRTDFAVLLATRYRHALRELDAEERAPRAQASEGPGRSPGSMRIRSPASGELAAILAACANHARSTALPTEPLAWEAVPPLLDEGDPKLLVRALAPAAARAGSGLVAFGTQRVAAADLARGARRLLQLAQDEPDARALDRAVRREFDVYRSPGAFGTGEVLFTSYASPVYEGSLARSDQYRFPIYRHPAKAGLPAKLTRARIYAGGLAGHGLELAWLADRMDEFQIQIEGSGFVKLAQGGYLHATFNGHNGHAYQSLGKAMLRDRLFRPWEIDNLAVRRYFREHPSDQQRYLEMNPSWVYFDARRIPALPQRPEYIRERSVAADRSVFARGQVAFADTFAPEYSAEGELTGRHPWRRFVVAQDVGGAIKGAGRIDLYQGQGEESQHLADTMKEPGALYLLVPKGTRLR